MNKTEPLWLVTIKSSIDNDLSFIGCSYSVCTKQSPDIGTVPLYLISKVELYDLIHHTSLVFCYHLFYSTHLLNDKGTYLFKKTLLISNHLFQSLPPPSPLIKCIVFFRRY